MPKFIDITGNKYGKLTVIGFSGRKNGKTLWKCSCECGNEKIATKSDLNAGKVKTCGVTKRHLKHGMSGTRIYKIWADMKNRCNKQNLKSYKYYGGKGIKYYVGWENFANFYEWALSSGYSDNLTIERIDFNGNYEPSNCCWITQKEQNSNTSRNLKIEINGVTKTLTQWAELYELSPVMISYRYKTGKRGFDLVKPSQRTKKGC